MFLLLHSLGIVLGIAPRQQRRHPSFWASKIQRFLEDLGLHGLLAQLALKIAHPLLQLANLESANNILIGLHCRMTALEHSAPTLVRGRKGSTSGGGHATGNEHFLCGTSGWHFPLPALGMRRFQADLSRRAPPHRPAPVDARPRCPRTSFPVQHLRSSRQLRSPCTMIMGLPWCRYGPNGASISHDVGM